jgi:hypothetical protein
MPVKEWTAEAKGHKIRVVNTWTGGTKLYIDEDLRDKNDTLVALRRRRWLSAPLVRDAPESGLVEVYLRAWFCVRAEILVDGVRIAGDRF